MSPAGPEDGDPGRPVGGGALLDEGELADWGRRLGAAAARERAFVALIGPLGSGKSTVIRAAARGAGVAGGAVPSPTYTLVHEHPLAREGGGPATFYHADLYRLPDAGASRDGGDVRRALEEIGWDRLLAADGPVFVEWADRAEGELPADRWEVRLRIPDDRSMRAVSVRRLGDAPRPPLPDGRGEGDRAVRPGDRRRPC